MKKTLGISTAFIFLCIVFFPSISQSQDTKKNVIYAELLGPGILYSINYERIINDNVSARFGASVWGYSYYHGNGRNIVLPMMINFFSGSGNSKFEFGAGIDVISMGSEDFGDLTPSYSSHSDMGILLVGSLGYRYQPADGGFHFRIVASPILSPITGFIIPSLGCSAGIGF